MNTTEQRRLADDAAFLAAEQSVAELQQQTEAAPGKVTSIAVMEELLYPLDDKMWERYDAIVSSSSGSLASAIIKLRVLADPRPWDRERVRATKGKSGAPGARFPRDAGPERGCR